MALLSSGQRDEVDEKLQLDESTDRNLFDSMIGSDIRAAVDAADAWIDDNAVSFNDALPVAFRNNATKQQKARLLSYVVTKRYLDDI